MIETPTFNVGSLESLLYQLRSKGLRVTHAHPERDVEFQRDPARLIGLVRQGVLLQLKSESLLSTPRRSDTDRLGRYLCAEGLAHALASDGHRAAGWRPVGCLADVMPAAVALVGAERAYWMMQTAPAAVIAGDELPGGAARPGRAAETEAAAAAMRKVTVTRASIGEQKLCVRSYYQITLATVRAP